MFLKLIVTVILSLSNYKIVTSRSEITNGVRIPSSVDYTDDPLVTDLSEGDTITGSILNKKYRYYKYTFSYTDDINSHSMNDSHDNVDTDRNVIREKATVKGSVNNVPASGINDISMSSSISSDTATENHARGTGRYDAFNPTGNELFESRNSIMKVRDPYDPSDPLKNSIQIDLEPISGDADLFVACKIDPTGDDYGIPSALIGHSNFSSQHYEEEVLSISATNPINCARQGNSGTFYIGVYGYALGSSDIPISI
jgi:hypothetical protein